VFYKGGERAAIEMQIMAEIIRAITRLGSDSQILAGIAISR
jgi:hypothetical protein